MSKVSGLGYLGATITDSGSWHRLLSTVYGLERRGDTPKGVHQYRLDEQHHRLALYEGDSDKIAHVGWEVETREDLRTLAAHLSENGISVEPGEARLCEERAVMELIACTGPDGLRTEIFFGPKQDAVPFAPARGMDGYNTGALGLGHIVLATDDPDETVKWYREMLGFSLSDYIFWDDIEATFLHCNARHHSLAFTNPVGPFKAGDLNHLMLESKSMNDVGRGYDIAQEHDVPIAMTLGRHTNDQTTSFYAYTPSGWWIEYGYGGLLIDDATWEPKFYDAPKLWGHEMRPPPE
jgi:2,3-dihydroxybiphenyl 1,2-dioxygenase